MPAPLSITHSSIGGTPAELSDWDRAQTHSTKNIFCCGPFTKRWPILAVAKHTHAEVMSLRLDSLERSMLAHLGGLGCPVFYVMKLLPWQGDAP